VGVANLCRSPRTSGGHTQFHPPVAREPIGFRHRPHGADAVRSRDFNDPDFLPVEVIEATNIFDIVEYSRTQAERIQQAGDQAWRQGVEMEQHSAFRRALQTGNATAFHR